MRDQRGFLAELKRRRVVRGAVLYLAGAFATLEAADVAVPRLGLPEQVLDRLVWLAALGLPLAVVLAWFVDLAPGGPEGSVTARVSPEGDRAAAWLAPRTLALVAALLLVGVGTGWMARSASFDPPPTPSENTIAVIPFDNLSSAGSNAFFAVGVQDEIATQLQKISALRVISRSSTMGYPPGADRPPIRTIGEELDARWVVEGSAARVGEQVRLNVQLSDAATGGQMWAEVYDGDLSVQGLLAFQGQVARRVAESLEATISPAEATRIAALPTESAEAYDLYLEGISLFGRRRESDLRQALALFEEAIVIDPDYALAYAGRAMVYAVLPFYSDTPTSESVTQGLAAAYRALGIDSTVAEAHAAVGDLLIHGRYDLDGAEEALRTAIRLRPSSAQAHGWLAEVLIAAGRVEEGVAAGERSIELDPHSAVMRLNLGRSLLEAGRLEAAIAALERGEALDPTFSATLETLGSAYIETGRYGDAAEVYRRYAAVVGPEASSLVAFAVALAESDRVGAVAALDGIRQSSWRLSPYTIARAYMQAGASEQALDWLERARLLGDPRLPFALGSALFEPLRGTPRFDLLASYVRQ